jgi:hypothetical protein
MFVIRCGLLIFALLVGQLAVFADGKLSLTKEDDGVTIHLDGELFTRYLTKSGERPVLWPVIGPTGKPITRAYPIAKGPEGEAEDHPHHRSVWIGYEGFNGVDFWHEPASGPKPFPKGQQVHREFVRTVCDGETATIVTKNDWLGPEDKKICEDERTWTFGTDGDQRWIDGKIVITASEDDLQLSDSKEGFFAVRVADSMNVDHKTGGRIINSRGQTDAKAWAQPAEWVDYQGPVDGEQVGFAILSHPESLNFPAPWHVRTYGLFGGNPLGKIAFTNDARDIRKRELRMTVSKGESIVLHYRIVLHKGDENEAKIAEKFKASPVRRINFVSAATTLQREP